MKIPEQYKCDFCKNEIQNYNSGKHKHSIPVITNCEWTEGKNTEEHVVWNHFDICELCIKKIANVKCGYRGADPRIIRGD